MLRSIAPHWNLKQGASHGQGHYIPRPFNRRGTPDAQATGRWAARGPGQGATGTDTAESRYRWPGLERRADRRRVRCRRVHDPSVTPAGGRGRTGSRPAPPTTRPHETTQLDGAQEAHLVAI